MIKTAQRKMLRLIVQTKREYKSKKDAANKKGEGIDKHAGEENKCATDKETEEGSDQNSDKDQDSVVSFQKDIDEEIDTTEKEEDWFEYIKRSTKEAEEHMKKMKIPCWIETHRRLKWRMARRSVSLPEESWTKKIFDWDPGLDNKIKTRRPVGRPKRRWEDDINEFFKPDETKGREKYDLTNNNSCMTEAEKCKEWKEKEEKFIKNSVSNSLDRCAERQPRVFGLGPSLTDLGTSFAEQASPLLLDYMDHKSIEIIQLEKKWYNMSVDDKRHKEKPQLTLDALETRYQKCGIGRLLCSASTSARR